MVERYLYQKHDAITCINEKDSLLQWVHWSDIDDHLDHDETRMGSSRDRRKFTFVCTNLVHYTENILAKSIGNDESGGKFTFKGFPWIVDKEINYEIKDLSWWGVSPPDDWLDLIKRDYKNNIEVIGSSGAFNGPSLCGPIGFKISLKDILNEYAKSRKCERSDLEFRILGTFHYQREIMYGILVCCKTYVC